MYKYNYSFIIPHKNCPDLLERCVDSIPIRDDIQIIVVDDNSADDKKPVIDRNGIEVIYLSRNESNGAGRARNIGLKHAKGKWLLFADADDYYERGFLEILDDYIETEYDVIYFNYIYKDGRSGFLLNPQFFHKFFVEYDGSDMSKDQVRFHHNVPWTKMVSQSYLERHNISFEETLNGNDILFSMKVGFYSDNIAVEKQNIYVYLKNENSIINKRITIDDALCRINHRVKQNRFYSFIGYPAWKASVFKLVLYYIWLLGIPFFRKLLLELYSIICHRNDWIKEFS